MKKQKCLIFIDHDIIVRHFILNNSFKDVEDKFETIYVFNVDPDTKKPWLSIDPKTLGLKKFVVTNIPRSRMGSWYHLYAITVLNSQRGKDNYKFRKKRMITINGVLRTFLYELQSLPPFFQWTKKRWTKKQGYWKPLLNLLEEERPSIILHPSLLTGYFANELIQLGKKLKIPTAMIMNSWDNPSQKAIVNDSPDLLCVWGKQTADHANEYMQLDKKNIRIIGAAQFDTYRTPVTESDIELRNTFMVPAGKPIILYGGVSKSINEMQHLKLLEKYISNNEIEDCHILYRPHPWRGGIVDGEENFFELNFKHVSMDPTMAEHFSATINNPELPLDLSDYNNIKKILSLVTGTISSMSTIQLETALFGKPSISFLSEEDQKNKYGKSVKIGTRLAHFNALWECPGVEFCRSGVELAASVNRLLTIGKNKIIRHQIKEFAEREYVSFDGLSFSKNLVDAVSELTTNFGQTDESTKKFKY